MFRKSWFIVLLAGSLGALSAWAGDMKAEPAASSEMAAEAPGKATPDPMTPPTPSPELKKLDYFVGTWNTTTEMLPCEMNPAGGKSTGTVKYKWGLNNMFLKSHYKSDPTGSMPSFEGMAMEGWDTEKKVYRFWWFDIWGMGVIGEGNWTEEGKAMTFTSEYDFMGMHRKERWHYTIDGPDEFSFAIEAVNSKGEWQKEMTGVYKRVKAEE